MEVGGVRLDVPAGAVNGPTRIEITRITVPDAEIGASLFGFVIEAFDDASGATVGWFAEGITLVIDAAGWDLAGIDPTNLQIAELWSGSWRAVGSGGANALVASLARPGTFAVFGQLLPARVSIDQTADAPDRGRRRIEPGSIVEVSISARPATRLASGLLIETIPAGWLVLDDDGGSFDAAASTVSWSLRAVPAGDTVTRTLRLRAPSIPYGGLLAVPSAFAARLEQGSDRTDGPDLAVLVAPRVLLPQVTAGRVERAGEDAVYLAPDRALVGQPRFGVFRLRFAVANADSVPVSWSPQLEFRRSPDNAFVPLPAGENVTGIAFYAAPEWTRQLGGGTAIGQRQAVLDHGTIGAATEASEQLVDGTRSMGLNPLREVVLPPRSRTVVEFSVRATVDAEYLAAYEFRVTDAGEPFAGAVEARVVLEAEPALDLSPGQRIGVPAGERPDARVTQIRFVLTGPSPMASGGGTSAGTTTADAGQPSLRFALVPPPDSITAAWVAEPIHGPSTRLVADSCAACHRGHSAAGPLLNRDTPPQLGQCATCHDGVAALDVQAGYAGTPENDPADRTYYRHEPTAFAGHVSAADDGFAGQLNRHNECTDCHNPHNSTSTPSAAGPAGWTGSGRVTGATSVTTTPGPSGPIYALASSTAFEYQLCLKCHSGYTQLPSNAGLPASRFTLDKGVEFDPANLSYHPVEAAGTNDTPAMALSLGGPSPFKQWSFTPDSTIRCVNCHADSRALAEPTPVPADASLPVHASVNRGILLAAYKDRVLKGSIEAYTAADFALCYLCHAEAPFRDVTGNERLDTNFRYHGVHVSGDNLLDHGLPGTDIDSAGEGGGLATCAECHFRIHSTSFAVNGQPAGSRLVNFAPNVTAPTGGTITWRQKSATQTGTCAIKCHAQPHADDY